MDPSIECILGIVDSYGVVSSKVIHINDNPLEYVHEEIWPISGRGKRWRVWCGKENEIERSDIGESFLDEDDKESIINHLDRRYGIFEERYFYTKI